MNSPQVQESVRRLLAVLDKDIDSMEKALVRLDEMRGYVIKHDDAALENLLRILRTENDGHVANNRGRRSACDGLAQALHCPSGEVTLARLQTILPDPLNRDVAARRQRLQTLVETLRREYCSTALLLAECARFNRQLWQAVFDRPATVTYNAKGTTSPQVGRALVDMQF